MKEMPKVGLGTYLLGHQDIDAVIKAAKESGYKLIDTAQIYNNEYQIGEALKKHNFNDVWITSKVYPANYGKHTLESVKESVRRLGREIDLMLLHGPIDDDAKNVEAYKELMKARELGLVKNIGVSNFMTHKIDAIFEATGEYPSNNQVIYSPVGQQKELFEYCSKNNISITGYSTIRPYLTPNSYFPEHKMQDSEIETINEIANKHNATGPQVIMAWALQNSVYMIPKSSNPKRVAQNIKCKDIKLTQDEMEVINNMAKPELENDYWEAKAAQTNFDQGLLFDKNYKM